MYDVMGFIALHGYPLEYSCFSATSRMFISGVSCPNKSGLFAISATNQDIAADAAAYSATFTIFSHWPLVMRDGVMVTSLSVPVTAAKRSIIYPCTECAS